MHTNEAAQARLSEFVGDRWNTNGGRNCTGACVKHTWQIRPGRWRGEEQPKEKSPLQRSPAGREDNQADTRPIFPPSYVVFGFPANSPESSAAFCGSFVRKRGVARIQRGEKPISSAAQRYLLCFHVYLIFPDHFQLPARCSFSPASVEQTPQDGDAMRGQAGMQNIL